MSPLAPDEPEVRIEILSPWVARVEVTRSDGGFGVYLEPGSEPPPGTRVYQFGYREAPLQRLVRPGSPEADWDIQALEKGRGIDALEALDSRIPQAYLDWFVESGDLKGMEIPWLLPVGRYFLVQSKRSIYPVSHAVFGNTGQVIAPPGILQMRSKRPFYSLVLGADRRYPPVIDQPLVGLAMPYCSSEYKLHGIFFFSFSVPRQLQRAFRTGVGVMLIVPAEGPLVLDSNSRKAWDSPEAAEEERREWAEELAPRFVDWCAGMSEQ